MLRVVRGHAANQKLWAIAAAVLAAALAAGCGPFAYAGQVTFGADDAVARAQAADAEHYSPYYWTRANEYLRMAREVAGRADFQGANRFGRLSEEAANRARKDAETMRAAGMPPWSSPAAPPAAAPIAPIAPAKDGIAPAKDAAPAKNIAPAKDTEEPPAPAKDNAP